MTLKKKTVLIIGCGNIAGGFDEPSVLDSLPLTHAGAFKQHQGYELIACVDPDLERLYNFQEVWGIKEAFTSLELIKDRVSDFDVISICSPTHLHPEHLSKVLKLQPKLVFCEKPITPSLTQTTKLTEQFDKAGILFAVNYTRRWSPDIQRLQSQLKEKKWGDIRSISASYSKGILNNGGHLIDLIHSILGPLKIEWTGSPVWDFWKDDPTVSFVLSSDKGPYVTVNSADSRDYSLFEIQIITEKGVITMKDGGLNWDLRNITNSEEFKGYKVLTPTKTVQGEYGLAMTNAVANIYDSLTLNAPLISNAITALQTQKICERIRDLSLLKQV